jgi:hypothetical protein
LQEALSNDFRVKFDAVRDLNKLGYSPEAVNVLLTVTCDKFADIKTRVYAASGLDSYYRNMTDAEKAAVREKLRALVLEEKGDTPDAVSRYLLKNGDAALVIEVVVPDSAIPPIPWTIFADVSKHMSSEQLMEMYRALPRGRRDDLFRRRSDIGRELVQRNDPRGVDILIQLLRPENAPGPQHRHNNWAFLAPKIGQSFDYKSQNYSPEFEQVLPKILAWWEENKATFDFKVKPTSGRPKQQ